jgi:ATP:ADP antiporter, AAA family
VAERTAGDSRSVLERVLGIVTRVEPGEGVTALLLLVDVFLLMTAYSAIKPVREGLILAMKSGAEYKSYMGGAIALALLVAVPAYARFADRLPRNRLVVGVTLFFASHLVLFWLGSAVPWLRARIGLVFYLWLGVFNMMVVAQFWAFATDLYDEARGKRLFPLFGVGQTVGAVAGSAAAVLLLRAIGVYAMLLLSAALLGATAVLTQIVHTRESSRGGARAVAPRLNRGGAFALVRKSKYLRYIAVFAVVFTFVNSNGEFILGKLMKEAALRAVESGVLSEDGVKEWVGAAYGRFYLFTNVATVAVQALLVSRIVRWGGLRVAFFVLPLIALVDALGIAALPLLLVSFWGKVGENSTDYSLNNTVRNMLWLPTTREMKYKAKQAIDTFFIRMGDVSSALLVYFAVQLAGAGIRVVAFTNAGLCLVWLVLARKIVRGYEAQKTPSQATPSSL